LEGGGNRRNGGGIRKGVGSIKSDRKGKRVNRLQG